MSGMDMSAFEDALKSTDSQQVRSSLTELAQDIGHFHDALVIANLPEELRRFAVEAYIKAAFTPRMSTMPLLAALGGLGQPDED